MPQQQEAHTTNRTYVVQLRADAPTRLVVLEQGRPARFLKHVALCGSSGFGFDGVAASDTALAILADFFQEELSTEALAQGQTHFSRLYLVLATHLRTFHGRTGLEITQVLPLLENKSNEC